MTERIYLSSPDVGQVEEDALVRAIRSGWVAPPWPRVDGSAANSAAYADRGHSAARSSGTDGMHLALLVTDALRNSVVVASTMTFASAGGARWSSVIRRSGFAMLSNVYLLQSALPTWDTVCSMTRSVSVTFQDPADLKHPTDMGRP